MLADRVFFWTKSDHAERLARSENNTGHAKVLFTLDTAALIAAHYDRAEISPFNSGATIHQAPRRGRATFASLDGLDYDVWQKQRGKVNPDRIKEVTIRGSVPDVMDFVVEEAA